jgi:hypothetical protein
MKMFRCLSPLASEEEIDVKKGIKRAASLMEAALSVLAAFLSVRQLPYRHVSLPWHAGLQVVPL